MRGGNGGYMPLLRSAEASPDTAILQARKLAYAYPHVGVGTTMKWYSALLAFETSIEPESEDDEPDMRYSLSAILFRARDGEAWVTAETLGRSEDDDLPFVTGWRFHSVLTVHDVAPDDEIRQGTEVFSTFASQETLATLQSRFALPSNPVEEATGRRYPA